MPKIKGLTKKQMETLKAKLLDEKNKLVFNQMKTEEISDNSKDGSDEIDQANADTSNAQRLRFRNREIFYAKKLNKALARMSEGCYGECEDCGEYIRYERLLARPTAELCITCKEESERDESSKILTRQSKSLGKTINLARA